MWILPDGRVAFLSVWHYEWLLRNPDAARAFGIGLEQLPHEEQPIRIAALRAGFARVNYEHKNGTLTLEVSSDRFGAQTKRTLVALVADNARDIYTIRVNVIRFEGGKIKAVLSKTANVFSYDDKEKAEHIPFVGESTPHLIVAEKSQKKGRGTKTDAPTTSTDLRVVKDRLSLKAKSYTRTGRLLERDELMALYRQRRQFRPTRAESRLILSSMRREGGLGLKLRQSELGWYWFRDVSRSDLCSLLMELARDRNPLVRWPAVNVLAFAQYEESFRLLKTLVEDQEVEIAVEAVKGLADFPATRVVRVLRRISVNEAFAPQVRRPAAKALAKLDAPGASALIKRLAVDAVPSMRQVAVELMREARRPNDARVLRRLAKDKSRRISGMALVTLAKLGRAAERDWMAELAKNRGINQPAAIRALGEFADLRDLPLLSTVRWAVSEVLVRYPCQEAVNLLKDLARGMQCGPAFDSLVRLPAKLTARVIRELAKDKSGNVHANLATHLGDWKHPGVRIVLRQLARDQDFAVRASAASSLGALGSVQDLPLLRQMCRDKNDWVRKEAVWTVGIFGQAADIPLLKMLAFDNCVEVRALAARTLATTAARKELLPWLDENIDQLSFEVLKELDYGLYAPAWLRKAEKRAKDDYSLMELGVCRHGV